MAVLYVLCPFGPLCRFGPFVLLVPRPLSFLTEVPLQKAVFQLPQKDILYPALYGDLSSNLRSTRIVVGLEPRRARKKTITSWAV